MANNPIAQEAEERMKNGGYVGEGWEPSERAKWLTAVLAVVTALAWAIGITKSESDSEK